MSTWLVRRWDVVDGAAEFSDDYAACYLAGYEPFLLREYRRLVKVGQPMPDAMAEAMVNVSSWRPFVAQARASYGTHAIAATVSRHVLRKVLEATPHLRPRFLFPEDDADGAKPQVGTQCNKWPWGAYETEELKALRAAVERFWVRFEPSESDTAPTNSAVINWLTVNHGLSGEAALRIATVIRADILKRGGRPKN